MPQVMDDETRAFLDDIEQRRGGKITYRAFSTFYADNNGKVCRYGVFFYQVNGAQFPGLQAQPQEGRGLCHVRVVILPFRCGFHPQGQEEGGHRLRHGLQGFCKAAHVQAGTGFHVRERL